MKILLMEGLARRYEIMEKRCIIFTSPMDQWVFQGKIIRFYSSRCSSAICQRLTLPTRSKIELQIPEMEQCCGASHYIRQSKSQFPGTFHPCWENSIPACYWLIFNHLEKGRSKHSRIQSMKLPLSWACHIPNPTKI